MADTVDLNNITEYNDSPAEMRAKCEQLASLIRDSKHCILFTGAGISTSANIPDFRGPEGVWTRQAQGRNAPQCVSMVSAVPTVCHRFINQLVAAGIVKYIVSQNVDGLHRRSGLAADKISELHGNCFLETCWLCSHDVPHDNEVHGGLHKPKTCNGCLERCPHFCHCTGHKCPRCGGPLRDSIIHFGEPLPVEALRKAEEHARIADLCIVLGSSLTVSPANTIPQIVATRKRPDGTRGTTVIVNLQKTPVDDRAKLLLHSRTDEVCVLLGELLGIAIPDARTVSLVAKAPSADETPLDSEAPSAPPTVVACRTQAPLPPPTAPTTVPSGLLRDTAALLTVGNEYEHVIGKDDCPHQWTMFVRNSSVPVCSVRYILHPTFQPREVVVTDPTTDFALRRRGWGTFCVGVEVTFADGRIANYAHELVFEGEGSWKTVPISG